MTTGATASQFGADANNEPAGKCEWYGYFKCWNRLTRSKVKEESSKNESGNEQDRPVVFGRVFGDGKDNSADPSDPAKRDHQEYGG